MATCRWGSVLPDEARRSVPVTCISTSPDAGLDVEERIQHRGVDLQWRSQAERFFLINLDRSVDRLAHMQQQFDRLGMIVDRVPAADGLNIPAWMQSEFKGPHQLSPGEVGCYASHLLVAQKIVAEGLPHAVALEDDAVLDDDFAATCADAIRHAPEDWDLIHLSAALSVKRPLIEIADLPRRRALVQYLKYPWTAAVYVISNRGARKCLAPMARVCPIDWANSSSLAAGAQSVRSASGTGSTKAGRRVRDRLLQGARASQFFTGVALQPLRDLVDDAPDGPRDPSTSAHRRPGSIP